MGKPVVRVLVAEDSPTVRELLVSILKADAGIEVVGAVDDGEKAVAAAARLRPDVVTMDVHMPGLGGFEATRRIMTATPMPILIVSGTLSDEAINSFRAVEAGAVALVRRPPGPAHPAHAEVAAELVRMIKLMAEVKVVRRWERRDKKTPPPRPVPASTRRRTVRVVAMGASTGGPAVLQGVFMELRTRLSVPVLVVQHIAPGFVAGLAEWLSRSTGIAAVIASDGETAVAGRVYFAPDDRHLCIDRNFRIVLAKGAPENGMRPSVSCLFRSVCTAFGPDAAGVLMTGMGRDGAKELKEMRDAGALTIVQDEQSSVVFGMPRAARDLDAAEHVCAADAIAATLEPFLPGSSAA
jgi:two-component system chemotaxis response regulator CheB